MQNEEEIGLETVIKRNSDPSRSSKKENIIVKAAKFTARTFSSLDKKRKERRLDKAFDKYNKKYAKMRVALKEANALKQEKQAGARISNSEVVAAYDKVSSYNKKIAKYAVKLLAFDIEKLGKAKAKGVARRLKLPRILHKRIRRVCENISLWKAARKETKEIKESTKDYISTSIPKALFKNVVTGELRDTVDAEKIQSLRIDDPRMSPEDRMANLKSFISVDGKTPLFPKTERASTDVPPTEPESTVEKEDPTVTTEDILKGFNKEKNSEEVEENIDEKKENTPKTQPRVTLDDLMNAMGVKPPTKRESSQPEQKPVQNEETSGPSQTKVEKTQDSTSKVDEKSNSDNEVQLAPEDELLISKRNREVHAINQLGSNIVALERQMASVNDPDVRDLISGYIEGLKGELGNIVARGPKIEKPEENNMGAIEKANEASSSETNPVESGATKQDDVVENAPDDIRSGAEVNSVPNEEKAQTKDNDLTEDAPSLETNPVEHEATKSEDVVEYVPFPNDMDNVVLTPPEDYMRAGAEANSVPSGLRVTPEDIDRIKRETEKIKTTIQDLDQTHEDLTQQKQLWQEMKAAVFDKIEAGREAEEKTRMNVALAKEVEQLASQVAASDATIGRAK